MPQLIGPVVAPGSLRARRQPALAFEELELRAWQTADASRLVQAYSDPAIQHWHSRAMTEPEAVAWIEDRAQRWQKEQGADWAVTTDEDGVVARVALRIIDLYEGWAEASYWVMPEARGRRIAPRALQAITTWAFDELGLHRIELIHSTANLSSCRVAERAGFALEGTRRQDELHADGWHDTHLHARTRPGDVAAPGAGE